MDSIKQLSVLLLCMTTVPVLLYVVSHRPPTPSQKTEQNDKETYLASLKKNPWQFGGGLECDHRLPDWHHCTVPKVIGQENIRRKLHGSFDCQSDVQQAAFAVTLSMYPNACEPEVLEGYDEAIVRHLTPRLEAMRDIQGDQLPQLTEEQLVECSIDKSTLVNDPIVYEFAARACTWRLK